MERGSRPERRAIGPDGSFSTDRPGPGWRGSRRRFLGQAAGALGALLIPRRLWAEPETPDAESLRQALAQSPLVYVSPLRSDGSESTCHAEVWFVTDGDDVLIVTTRDRWRARAVQRGLRQARLWVGDFGVWKKSDRFRTGPHFVARASLESDPHVRERALERYGRKYAQQGWQKWGPRFRQGFADGSRVLIRYRMEGRP